MDGGVSFHFKPKNKIEKKICLFLEWNENNKKKTISASNKIKVCCKYSKMSFNVIK